MSGFSWRIAFALSLTAVFTARAQDAAAPLPEPAAVTEPVPAVVDPSPTQPATDSVPPATNPVPPVIMQAADSGTAAPAAPAVPAAPAAPLAAPVTPAIPLTATVDTPAAPLQLDSAVFGRTRHLKSDPSASKLYRSPRKAFFYSLLIPGAGQAYTGHWKTGAAFLAADVALGTGWWYYAIHKSDEKMREAHRYANAHWSSSKYEKTYDSIYIQMQQAGRTDYDTVFASVNASRTTLCADIYGTGNENYNACAELPSNANYNNLHYAIMVKGINPSNRDFSNSTDYYALIGDQNEFVTGWEDATSPSVGTLISYYDSLNDGNVDTKAVDNPFGVSAMQATYNAMRSKSNDYARMQKWFLGGMLLNHLASALDAALLAQAGNRRLYNMEASWWENIHFTGGLAWAAGAPAPTMQTWIAF